MISYDQNSDQKSGLATFPDNTCADKQTPLRFLKIKSYIIFFLRNRKLSQWNVHRKEGSENSATAAAHHIHIFIRFTNDPLSLQL